MGKLIQLQGIERRFRVGPMSLEVLRGVSLEIDAGELVALSGPSGSGKTVLLNILGLLDTPDAGRYTLAGREVAHLDDDERTIMRNRMVGFILQNPLMLSRLTAEENVAVPLLYRRMKTTEALRRAREQLARVGLADWAGHKPQQMSGGQLQRVAIARALVGEPELVLADEPTAALDPAAADQVLSLLSELNARDGVTIVLVTHNPASAERCSRRYFLAEGTLRAVEEVAAT